MNRVYDTSALIELLTATPIGEKVRYFFDQEQTRIMPTIIQAELMKWACRNFLKKNADKVKLAEDITEISYGLYKFSFKFAVVPQSYKIAEYAGMRMAKFDNDFNHLIGIADAIIYATVREFKAELITCDNHFRGLPNVIIIDKLGMT